MSSRILCRKAAFGAVFLAAAGVAEIPVGVARRRPLVAARVDLAPIEAGALVRVGEQVVGASNRLEPLRRLRLAGIDVRVKFLGELAVGRPDGRLVIGALDAERRIGIVCHRAEF